MSNPEGRNQFTIAAENGEEAPESHNAYTKGTRERMDPLQRAKIRAQFAAQKLEDFMRGDTDLSPAQVSACKILMDKGMPSLQSVDYTEHTAPQSEEDIIASLAELVKADPAVRAQIQSILNGAPTPVDREISAQQAA